MQQQMQIWLDVQMLMVSADSVQHTRQQSK
jgi:hypothetical protein